MEKLFNALIAVAGPIAMAVSILVILWILVLIGSLFVSIIL